MNETSGNKNKTIGEKIGNIVSKIIATIFVISFAWYGIRFFLQDSEKISFDAMNRMVIQESRHPFGSIFNRDELIFGLSEFEILKRSFLGEKRITLPYSRVEEIVLIDGQFWNSLEINQTGLLSRSIKIYFKNADTKKYIMALIASRNIDTVTIEKESILKRIYIVINKV